jgi:hypothetical protein
MAAIGRPRGQSDGKKHAEELWLVVQAAQICDRLV